MPHQVRQTIRVVVLAAVIALLVPAGMALAQEDTLYPPPDEGVMPGEVIVRGTPAPADSVAPSDVRQEVLQEVLADELAVTGTDLLVPLAATGLLLIVLGSATIIAIRRRRAREDGLAAG